MYAQGNFAEAEIESQTAGTWTKVGLCFGGVQYVVAVIVVVLEFTVLASGAGDDPY